MIVTKMANMLKEIIFEDKDIAELSLNADRIKVINEVPLTGVQVKLIHTEKFDSFNARKNPQDFVLHLVKSYLLELEKQVEGDIYIHRVNVVKFFNIQEDGGSSHNVEPDALIVLHSQHA